MKMLLEQWSSNEKCWYIIVAAKGEKKIKKKIFDLDKNSFYHKWTQKKETNKKKIK